MSDDPSAHDPGKIIVRVAEIEVGADRLDDYLRLLSEEIDASLRSEPGVLMLNAVHLADTPTQIRLLEVYADPAAYAAHLETPHFRKYKVLTEGMVRSLRLLDAKAVRLSLDPK